MYVGWTIPFAVNRPLMQLEKDAALPRQSTPNIDSNDHFGLIRFNSTYIDWIDRRFLFRGAFGSLWLTFIVFLLLWAAIYIGIGIYSANLSISMRIYGTIGVLVPVGGLVFFARFFFNEYFTYTYYPIRFNRKTRMVHVFRGNGPGEVLSVPWEKVYFHLGRSITLQGSMDIRGEILDGETVLDTFALGHPQAEPAVREMWEFIRRYMDEGPEAVTSSPLDRYVDLSVSQSFRNCFIVLNTYYRNPAGLILPFVFILTLVRWVVLHTCLKPVFPPEIRATCKVEPDDPNVWPTPSCTGEFANIPGRIARAEARSKRIDQEIEREKQKK
jgi:hypothetical protein